MRRVCVYCGSNEGNDPAYLHAAQALGHTLAHANIGLVYGGASIGLMGAVANAVLAAGGEVTGVIPRALVEKEMLRPPLAGWPPALLVARRHPGRLAIVSHLRRRPGQS